MANAAKTPREVDGLMVDAVLSRPTAPARVARCAWCDAWGAKCEACGQAHCYEHRGAHRATCKEAA